MNKLIQVKQYHSITWEPGSFYKVLQTCLSNSPCIKYFYMKWRKKHQNTNGDLGRLRNNKWCLGVTVLSFTNRDVKQMHCSLQFISCLKYIYCAWLKCWLLIGCLFSANFYSRINCSFINILHNYEFSKLNNIQIESRIVARANIYTSGYHLSQKHHKITHV